MVLLLKSLKNGLGKIKCYSKLTEPVTLSLDRGVGLQLNEDKYVTNRISLGNPVLFLGESFHVFRLYNFNT